MKIPLRPFKLLLPLVLVFCTEPPFWELVLKDADDVVVLKFQPAVSLLCLLVALWYWRRMAPAVGRAMLLTVLYMGALVLESYATHGSWVPYMHVFGKVLVLFIMYASYGYYRQRGLPPLRAVVGLLVVVLLVNLFVVHPESLSLQGFLDNDRGVTATSALLLVLPVLLCLNWYLQRGSTLMLGVFFLALGMVVFLQHRSVWMATLTGLATNLLLVLWRVPSVRFSPHRVGLLVGLPLVVGVVGGLATILQNPDVVKKFETSYEDITKPDKQGTGSWRIKQMEAYQPLVKERPLGGWRMEGFEVPIQFYDPTSNAPMWADGTGHHFHSFYLDRLFYFGWVGLLLVVVLPFVQIVTRLAHRGPFSAETAALISLYIGCLVFGLSYDWPAYLYALLGLMLAAATPPAGSHPWKFWKRCSAIAPT